MHSHVLRLTLPNGDGKHRLLCIFQTENCLRIRSEQSEQNHLSRLCDQLSQPLTALCLMAEFLGMGSANSASPANYEGLKREITRVIQIVNSSRDLAGA